MAADFHALSADPNLYALAGFDERDLQGLLEIAQLDHDRGGSLDEEDMGWKEKAKQVVPHILLVLVSCVWATIWGFVFHHIESTAEVTMKRRGLGKVRSLQEHFIDRLWTHAQTSGSMNPFLEDSHFLMRNLTLALYRTHEGELITAADIKLSSPRVANGSEPFLATWNVPASIFFSATTMTTIGYGNLVPLTGLGRWLCIAFALVGTPLAIITIGDVGKFMSEWTIWLYKRYCMLKDWVKQHCPLPVSFPYCVLNLRKRSEADMKHMVTDDAKGAQDPYADEDDSELGGKTDVPVFMVFSILLVYTAFGAVLFAWAEAWSYVDAFYFCFITLTTVGFGDKVPGRQTYLALYLFYIGVGLCVTTMCIDLVGIEYIRKIHYFGRKFRGTDVLTLLRRRKMFERRLALAAQQDRTDLWLQSTRRTPSIHVESPKPQTPDVPSWPVHYSESSEEQVNR